MFHQKLNDGKHHICPDCGNLMDCQYHAHGIEIEGWTAKKHEIKNNGIFSNCIKITACPLFVDSTDCYRCKGCESQNYYGGNNKTCETRLEKLVKERSRHEL